ncbi:Hemoglobin-like protein HbO [hydrothermal vent metagenome]|uniref:Hemoglobin-like protein HbO n=1 Tax=hydrothermal vent metagenome TaxID=652676 RepID=A0A1W1EAB2_9ZZZZ
MATPREIMNLPMTPVEKGEQVHFKNPPKAFFDAIGGEAGMQALMYDFYDKIYESNIAHFFPQDEEAFDEVKKKNSKFFIQICGGPKVYENEAKGMDLNEYMIRVHDDFSINENNRIEWLGTMREALADKAQHVDIDLIREFWEYLENFSKLTVNTFADGSTYYAAYTQAKEEN